VRLVTSGTGINRTDLTRSVDRDKPLASSTSMPGYLTVRQDDERARLFPRAPIGSSRLSRAAGPQDRQKCRHGALGRTT
jgi:hypothetical protein